MWGYYERVLKSYDTGASRRDFLTAAVMLGPAWLRAAGGIDPRVEQVLSKTIGIDMHNHVYPAGTEPYPQNDPPQGPGSRLLLKEEIRRSGLTGVCASRGLDFIRNKTPGEAWEHFLRWLTAVDAQLEKEQMRRALNLKDLQAAHAQGQATIVQSVEGAQFIEGKLERVHEIYERGVRHLQLLHEQDDLVAPLGDVITSPAHLGGLTAFGAKVVKECNRLGILVDLAHARPETVRGALQVITQPFIVSHTGLDSRLGGNPKMAERLKPHLISKESAKVVADAGGVVGVWTKLADSPKEFVENLKAMVDVVGVDHAGIGTDTDLLSKRTGNGTNKAWPGLSAGFFRAVAREMLRQGFTAEEIGKVGGGNFCRVFGEATAGHA